MSQSVTADNREQCLRRAGFTNLTEDDLRNAVGFHARQGRPAGRGVERPALQVRSNPAEPEPRNLGARASRPRPRDTPSTGHAVHRTRRPQDTPSTGHAVHRTRRPTRTRRPRDTPSTGHAVHGTRRPRDTPSTGHAVHGTRRPRDTPSTGHAVHGTRRPQDTPSAGRAVPACCIHPSLPAEGRFIGLPASRPVDRIGPVNRPVNGGSGCCCPSRRPSDRGGGRSRTRAGRGGRHACPRCA